MTLDRTDPTFLSSYAASEFTFGISVEDDAGPLPSAVTGRLQVRDAAGVLVREWTLEDGTLRYDEDLGGYAATLDAADVPAPALLDWGLELDGDVIVTGKLRLRPRVVT